LGRRSAAGNSSDGQRAGRLLPDNPILLRILNSVRHVNVRRGHSILEAPMFRGIYLEGELVTLVLVGNAGNDNGGERAVRAVNPVMSTKAIIAGSLGPHSNGTRLPPRDAQRAIRDVLAVLFQMRSKASCSFVALGGRRPVSDGGVDDDVKGFLG
jgi:hypothetical protein